MAAPQVQTLAQIMTDLAPASSKQTELIQGQQAGLDAKYAETQKGLDATKANSFTTINNQATGRGMSFSGIPLDEQATYLSQYYMPAVANLKTAQTNENMGFSKQLADIYSQNYNTAYGTQQTQTSALQSWNNQQDQNAFSASQQEKSNAFSASENAKNRAASASESAANRAAANAGPTAGETSAFANGIAQALRPGAKLSSIKLSPEEFRNGYAKFYSSTGGGDLGTYKLLMQPYINTTHAQDYQF